MKLAAISLFSVAFCLAAEFSSAQWSNRNLNYRVGRNTNVNWNGLNHRSNNGRHNTNLNYRNVRYNYAGNRWNTNVNHNFGNRQTNLNSNYRRNHNFRAGYNWQNRQTNLGYKWNFGKRRRSIDSQDELLDFLTIENEPRVFLTKLQSVIDMFIKTHQDAAPELEILAFSLPDDKVTNVTVAEEIVCVVQKLQKTLPKSLGNFIVKMIKYHGKNFGIKDLKDFFSVDPVDEDKTEGDDSEDACEAPEYPASSELFEGGELLEMKKFVATLITVAMEYQKILEQKEANDDVVSQ